MWFGGGGREEGRLFFVEFVFCWFVGFMLGSWNEEEERGRERERGREEDEDEDVLD